MEPKVHAPDSDYDKHLAASCMCREGTIPTAEIVQAVKEPETKPVEKVVPKKREPDPVLISSSDEAMFQFDFTTQLFYRLLQDDTTPQFIEQAKRVLGEERVQEVMRQVAATPAEQKKAFLDYAKAFK